MITIGISVFILLICQTFDKTQAACVGSTFCQPGWTSYNNSCYFFNSQPMYNSQAAAWCQANNASLVSIRNLIELNFTFGLLANRTNTYSWVLIKINLFFKNKSFFFF